MYIMSFMLHSTRYPLALDQYLPVAPLWAMCLSDHHHIDIVSLHEVCTLHLSSPAWLNPSPAWLNLSCFIYFVKKAVSFLFVLCFVQQSQCIWIHSQIGKLPHFVCRLLTSHGPVHLVHGQVYMDSVIPCSWKMDWSFCPMVSQSGLLLAMTSRILWYLLLW